MQATQTNTMSTMESLPYILGAALLLIADVVVGCRRPANLLMLIGSLLAPLGINLFILWNLVRWGVKPTHHFVCLYILTTAMLHLSIESAVVHLPIIIKLGVIGFVFWAQQYQKQQEQNARENMFPLMPVFTEIRHSPPKSMFRHYFDVGKNRLDQLLYHLCNVYGRAWEFMVRKPMTSIVQSFNYLCYDKDDLTPPPLLNPSAPSAETLFDFEQPKASTDDAPKEEKETKQQPPNPILFENEKVKEGPISPSCIVDSSNSAAWSSLYDFRTPREKQYANAAISSQQPMQNATPRKMKHRLGSFR